MAKNRRDFLKISAAGSLGLLTGTSSASAESKTITPNKQNTSVKERPVTKPVVVSTWSHGMPANEVAWEILENGGSALDAVEAGVRVSESDPDNMTVGLGGFPDQIGRAHV